ncbi:MAG: 30S ribosomal protein S16 [Spartobacteria bacterium]|nr:30S ribosomal protein S16 [Spartobacteria bacterium]
MAVKVRLRRMGNANTPFYRVIVADSRSPSKGRFIETIGWYDPKLEGVNFKLDVERLDYWASNGAQLSDTVRSLANKAKRLAKRTVAASAVEAAAPVEETAAPEVASEETQPATAEA